MEISLSDKVAVITGASGDIGTAMAKALYDAGASLILASRNEKRLEEAAEKAGLKGDRVIIKGTDVTDARQVTHLIEAAALRFKRLDILVTAAGSQIRRPAIEVSPEEWDRVIGVNLTGTFFCCQAAAKEMIKTGKGRMILISSLTAEIGIPNIAPYVASKGGIRQLAKALAAEWAKYGITVNCIGPGRIKTRMTEDIFSDAGIYGEFMRLIPMGRAGLPQDLSGIILFLASNLSDYITGQSIYIDGGWLASGGNPKG